MSVGRPSKLKMAGDVASFILAWVIIFWQMLFVEPSQVNETFLWLAAALLGIPGGTEAVARIRGGSPMDGSSSVSPSSASPSSSPTSPGDDQ
jgi:hypothetical protein